MTCLGSQDEWISPVTGHRWPVLLPERTLSSRPPRHPRPGMVWAFKAGGTFWKCHTVVAVLRSASLLPVLCENVGLSFKVVQPCTCVLPKDVTLGVLLVCNLWNYVCIQWRCIYIFLVVKYLTASLPFRLGSVYKEYQCKVVWNRGFYCRNWDNSNDGGNLRNWSAPGTHSSCHLFLTASCFSLCFCSVLLFTNWLVQLVWCFWTVSAVACSWHLPAFLPEAIVPLFFLFAKGSFSAGFLVPALTRQRMWLAQLTFLHSDVSHSYPPDYGIDCPLVWCPSLHQSDVPREGVHHMANHLPNEGSVGGSVSFKGAEGSIISTSNASTFLKN